MYSFTQKVNQTATLFARRRNPEEQFLALTANIKRIRMRLDKAIPGSHKHKTLTALLATKIDSACILANAIGQRTIVEKYPPRGLDGNL